MNTIAEHDVVVAIISDAYLKSASCLYEASIALKMQRLYQIIINKNDVIRYSMCTSKCADIRTDEGKLSYYKYWEARKVALEHEESQIAETARFRYSEILKGELGDVLDYLSSHVYVNFTRIIDEGLDIIFKDTLKEERAKKTEKITFMEAFNALANPWTPIHAPYTIAHKSYYIGNLPSSMTIMDDNNISFNGKIYSKEVIQVGVREEGPAAWGYGIKLPIEIFFRYTQNFGEKISGWHRVQEHDIVYLELVGSGLETLQIKDDTLEWKAYIAYDLDGDE